MNLQEFQLCDDAMFALAFDKEPAFFEEVWHEYVDKGFQAESAEVVHLETITMKKVISAVGRDSDGKRREHFLMFFDDDMESEFPTYLNVLQLADKNRKENGYDIPHLLLLVKNCKPESRLNHMLLTDQKMTFQNAENESERYEIQISVMNLRYLKSPDHPSIFGDFLRTDPDTFYFKPLGEKLRYLRSAEGIENNIDYWVKYSFQYKVLYFHQLVEKGFDKDAIMKVMELSEAYYEVLEQIEEKLGNFLSRRAILSTGSGMQY